MKREPHYHHTAFAAAGPLQEMLPAEHVQRHADWLADQAKRAGLTLEEEAVVVDRIARRRPFGLIRQARALQKGQAEALFREGMDRLQSVPDFWDAARDFQRSLVPCAENKLDQDERPDGMRGVEADTASKRFQGARMVPRDDRRVRQNAASAARFWVLANA
jgi:hypothetical protein